MGTLGNSNQTLIRHDFKRAVYRALLSEFPIDDVKEYFGKVPLVIGEKRFSAAELFGLLWREKSKIPSCFDVATDNELEAFVLSKGRTFDQVMRKILWLNNNSSVMPGRVVLGWFYPKLESLFTSLDSRDIAFSLLTIHNENWIPGVVHRRIKKQEEGGWVKSTMLFVLDTTYREYLDWDLELIGGPQILSVPVMLGMPPFEKFGMLADTRPVERVVWRQEDAPEWDGDTLLIRGTAHGKKVSFASFLLARNLDLAKFNPPDLAVSEITRDYFCPIRNRVVLHAGCVYGAPVYLHTVEHRKLNQAKKGILEHFVSDLVREEDLKKDDLEAKHLALLASLDEKWEFRYFPADESMTLNEAHFTKGIAAKILKYLVEAYLNEGKREFEYRELKRLLRISAEPAPCFGVNRQVISESGALFLGA